MLQGHRFCLQKLSNAKETMRVFLWKTVMNLSHGLPAVAKKYVWVVELAHMDAVYRWWDLVLKKTWSLVGSCFFVQISVLTSVESAKAEWWGASDPSDRSLLWCSWEEEEEEEAEDRQRKGCINWMALKSWCFLLRDVLDQLLLGQLVISLSPAMIQVVKAFKVPNKWCSCRQWDTENQPASPASEALLFVLTYGTVLTPDSLLLALLCSCGTNSQGYQALNQLAPCRVNLFLQSRGANGIADDMKKKSSSLLFLLSKSRCHPQMEPGSPVTPTEHWRLR
ncbi:Wd Repeat-Containing Protein 47 [Manis pentadactyla]|nr:Wd Repeat-Containing Protein 47 [Manis pentadactyla]